MYLTFRHWDGFPVGLIVKWNCSKIDTIGTKDFVLYIEMSLAQGLVVDHAPPTVMANHDKAGLSTIKKTILIRDSSISSS